MQLRLGAVRTPVTKVSSMAPRPTRTTKQWLPLTALVLGLIGSAAGALAGQPNSWLWFAAGVVVAVVWAVLRRRWSPSR
ncbi:hypothetical protein RU06_02265 [Curtobacterium flaccumfaciens]|nr:hypothetical protein RU06_02265 [Curtobacterium flaccumfaciens]